MAETLEKTEVGNTPDDIMNGISEQKDTLQVILRATTLEEDVLKRLEGEHQDFGNVLYFLISLPAKLENWKECSLMRKYVGILILHVF